MSFYRIYRPQIIEEIDNVAVREAILRLLGKPKSELPHAYLFTGPRGGGKTTAARIIAKLFNCEHPSAGSGPCGKCEQCVAIAEGKNLDVLEIDAASNRGIDEIRALRDGINLAPAAATHKIYIIDEVHMLTTEAFNALLKTLEEPPAHAVFVLATTNPEKVPVTIKSRCIFISFARASIEELTQALERIVKSEKISIDKESLELIAGSVDGSFRDAVKCLEQVSFTKGAITPEVVRKILSVSEEKIRSEFLTNLQGKDAKKALHSIDGLVREGKDIKMFLMDCLGDLEKYLIHLVQGADAGGWIEEDLHTVIRKLSLSYAEMKTTAITQLPLELAVVEYCGQKSSATPIIMKSEKIEQIKSTPVASASMLTLEHLTQHWSDVIAELKPYNHSVAGVMRSTRPSRVADGIVTIEAFYTFHKDKLSEIKTREVLSTVLKKLFGEVVKVEIVLGKK
jgi:DNA polymerase III subunit gamma/tau